MDSDIYQYTVIPFGLINADATYQKILNKLFLRMIGDTKEAYVDSMLVKSIKSVNRVEELRNTIERIRLHQVCLNPARVFGIHSGKFLGYMVRHRCQP